MASWVTKRVADEFEKSVDLFQKMRSDENLSQALATAVELSTEALRRGNKLMFVGNGGSAADAQHWAGELVSRFYFDRSGLAAVALTTDTSILTAIGNDYGYDYVFARQVEAIGQKGDVLLAISTSGNSANVVHAVEVAIDRGIRTIGFTGCQGGAMATKCELCLHVPSSETPKIQEGHEALGHLLCGLIEEEIFGGQSES